jgi:two-component system, chemotaxis family, CheB/CheR fusion protein
VLNQAAESFWGIRASDLVGRSILDVNLPSPMQQILPQIAQTRSQQRETTIEEMDLGQVRGRPLKVRVVFSPMLDVRGSKLGSVIITENVTAQTKLRAEIEASNEQLQATNEELETTNEELQSTNEELETTNEELETTNEELQSTNEELSTTNDELAVRTAELNIISLFFGSVLNSLDIPVVSLDEEHAVMTWNPAAEAFYGLESPAAVGKNFLALPLPVRVARTREKLSRLRETRKIFRSRPIPYRTRAGEERQAVVEYLPLIDERGDYKGAICLVKDSALEALRPASPL